MTSEIRVRTLPNGAQMKLCVAQKRDGTACSNIAVSGRDYCNHHGGKALVGPDSPQFRTGLWTKQRRRFSQVAPTLLRRIDELREDPELFSLRDDAAYLTALMDVRAEAASNGISVEHYETIRDQIKICKAAPDEESYSKSFKQLEKIVNEGIDVYRASQDVVHLIDKRTEIVEAEARMMHTKAYTLEVDQAYSLAMQILKVVKDCVRNADELSAIKAGFSKLLKQYQQDDVIDAEVIDDQDESE